MIDSTRLSPQAMEQRSSKLPYERRTVSALPGQRETRKFGPTHDPLLRRAVSSAGSSRTLALSCNSEMFQKWLTRDPSALSVHSTSSSCSYTRSEGRHGLRRCRTSCGSYGRQTKASMLRLNSCPIQSEQPTQDHQEVIKKRKEFAQRCKSLSAAHVRCKTLPDGESLHAFLTGARYNRAHHMDSRSLERIRLYIPRCDATRSFVNDSSTLSDGVKCHVSVNNSSKSTLSESTSECPTKPDLQATRGNVSNVINISFPSNHGQHTRRVYHSNPSPKTQEEASERESTTKPSRRHLVKSRENLTSTGPVRKMLASPALSQDLKECVISENDELPPGCLPLDVASANGSDVAIRVDHKHPNTGQSSSPQHSTVATPSTVTPHTCTEITELEGRCRVREAGKCSTEQEPLAAMATCTTAGVGARGKAELTTVETGNVREQNNILCGALALKGGTKQNVSSTLGEGVVVRSPKMATTIVDDTDEEMISPEARALITDEILRECQSSGSSCASSSISQETAMHDNITNADIARVSRGEMQTSSVYIDTHSVTSNHNNQSSISTTSGPKGPGHKVDQLRGISVDMPTTTCGYGAVNDLQAGESECKLSAKSSCIFVDMSSLNLDQVQTEDEVNND